MLDVAYEKVKKIIRPVTQHRRLLERACYFGTEILSAAEGNDLLSSSIHRPAAIGKIGASEMGALRHFLRRADSEGYCESWGYHKRLLYRIAGVYPPDPNIFSHFCITFADSLRHLDVLAVWFNFGENAARRRFAPHATVTALRALEPYYHSRPWSCELAGKRVLVVSPFAETIQAQYPRRREVWPQAPEILPEFHLLTLRVPLSAYLTPPKYPDWFSALDAMCEEMSSLRFDVAIVGAGAWSIPLVAHAKSLGAWAIHLGGATQILFGIKGKAWEANQQISAFFNEAWTRPSFLETPQLIGKIEDGRYW
ncbi:MAG TPA: hypothetical protein VEX69_00595 [Candidatus Limnocylindria bacterium]|nr:hypothetical protein [Candidatus Limnocylindria bacterium]